MAPPIKYFLCRVVEGSTSRLEITQQEYLEFLIARNQLDHVLDVDDKYDVTIQNYIEFETAIVQEAVRDLVESNRNLEKADRIRRLLARRLSNVLSSARLHVGTLRRHSREILTKDSGPLRKIENTLRECYDNSLNYRLIDALRNYAQHHALPTLNR